MEFQSMNKNFPNKLKSDLENKSKSKNVITHGELAGLKKRQEADDIQ